MKPTFPDIKPWHEHTKPIIMIEEPADLGTRLSDCFLSLLHPEKRLVVDSKECWFIVFQQDDFSAPCINVCIPEQSRTLRCKDLLLALFLLIDFKHFRTILMIIHIHTMNALSLPVLAVFLLQLDFSYFFPPLFRHKAHEKTDRNHSESMEMVRISCLFQLFFSKNDALTHQPI